jgi:hypothetical protein
MVFPFSTILPYLVYRVVFNIHCCAGRVNLEDLMKYWHDAVRAALLLLLLTGGRVASQESGTGVGIALGSITGLSVKIWRDATSAWSGGAAWSFEGEDSLHLHWDYLHHGRRPWRLREIEEGYFFRWYYGLGCRAKLEEDSRLGMRLPVGIAYLFTDAPFDAFFELAPLLDIAPATEARLDGAIGVRYFF